jgi:hypothetical protein
MNLSDLVQPILAKYTMRYIKNPLQKKFKGKYIKTLYVHFSES